MRQRPTSTPVQTSAPTSNGPGYRLTVFNLYPQAIYVFLDDQYLYAVATQRSGVYSPVAAGQYRVRYCYDRAGKTCPGQEQLYIQGDTRLAASGVFSAPQPGLGLTQDIDRATSTPLPVAETLSPGGTPTAGPPSVGPPNPATLTALAPTLAAIAPTQTAIALITEPPTLTSLPPELADFKITVYNRFNSSLKVFVDGNYLVDVPPGKYIWHLGIRGGWRSLKFCPWETYCVRRDVYLASDSEFYIGP